jgi:predicted nucleic acid-binding protein
MPKKKRSIQAYAFIDTNIFLDFYRGKNEASLSLLEKLSQVKDRIICTYQVEMEFLKNRQKQIKKILSDTKVVTDVSLPAALADTRLDVDFAAIKKDAKKASAKLEKHILKLLKNRENDRVYNVLKRVFTNVSAHVLTRKMPIRQKMKRLAWRRFILGYPPRKEGDTSMGDALNWEWVVHCAMQMPGRFYLVSRDNDYGCEHDGSYILNDQLMREFRDRVGNKSIVYTHKLSEALEALDVKVTSAEKKAEVENVIELIDISLPEHKGLTVGDLEAMGYSAMQIFEMIRRNMDATLARRKATAAANLPDWLS